MVAKQKKGILKRWKLYWDLSNVSEIARRYFVMNFTDGLLTTFGIVIGFFALFIFGNLETSHTRVMLVPGLAMSISMGVSGTIGGYLAEKSERDKAYIHMQKAMGINISQEVPERKPTTKAEKKKEILKHMIYLGEKSPLKKGKVILALSGLTEDNNQKEEKTLIEKAESFATYVSIAVNGGASVLGGILVLIPFMVSPTIDFSQFFFAILIVIVTVIILGIYLAKISQGSILIYLLHLGLAVAMTIVFSLLLGV